MAGINLPEDLQAPLERLAKLSAVQRKLLLKALEQHQPTFNYRLLIDNIANAADWLPQDDVESIVPSLLSVCNGASSSGVPTEQFTAAVAASSDLHLTQPQRKVLQNYLRDLLALHSLQITAKALGVLTDHERVFLKARVISDIRPVFEEEVGDASDYIIVHMLKVSCRQNSQPADLFFAMDGQDVRSLRNVLDRAILKEQSLRTMLKRGGLNCLPVGEGEEN